MAKCKLAEAIKYVEDLYQQTPSTNKSAKNALKNLYSKISLDRAEIQQAAALLKVDPYPQKGPSVVTKPVVQTKPVETPVVSSQPKSLKGKMTYSYGANKRAGLKADTTADAIRNGERTATTRYEGQGNIDYWKSAKVGDIIEFEDANGDIVQVRVTKEAYNLKGSGLTPTQWSQLEGWSTNYFHQRVAKKVAEGKAWQIQYELVSKPEDTFSYTNHSGGANGADTEWGKIGESYGVKSKHYYHGTRTPSGTDQISNEDYEEGRFKVAEAAKSMFGYKYKTMKSPLLIRNWNQVKYADAIFAVSEIVPKGKPINKQTGETRKALKEIVSGGTGYAVEMGIQAGKPVYVFDQTQNSWFKWNADDNKFDKIGTPTLTPNFAGIGSRQLTEQGKQAIQAVYEKTFNETGEQDQLTVPVQEPVPEKEGYTISGNMKTNAGQTAAIDAMKDWYNSKKGDIFLLEGRGGTGKTTVINVLLRELGISSGRVDFAAPTNKAVKVLRKANKDTSYSSSGYYTIAQILGIKPEYDRAGNMVFKQDFYANPPSLGKILVVDEASMIHSENFQDLMAVASSLGTKIIFMGDNAQLPPIKDKKAPIRSVVFNERDNNAKLTELMRQGEGSPIIQFTDSVIEQVDRVEDTLLENQKAACALKTEFRKKLWDGNEYPAFDGKKNEGVILTNENFESLLPSFLRDLKKNPTTTKFINYNRFDHFTTTSRVKLIREALYGAKANEEQFISGEPLMLNGTYEYNITQEQPSRVDNGEEFTVVSSKRVSKAIEYRVGKDVIKSQGKLDVYEIVAKNNVDGEEIVFNKPVSKEGVDNLIDEERGYWIDRGQKPGRAFMLNNVLASELSHGYIINTHRSQGSTYDNVYVDLGNIAGQSQADINGIVKSLYVAASRPRKKLVVVDNRPAYANQITNGMPVRQPEEIPAVQTQNKMEQAEIIEKVEKCASKGS